MSEELLQLGYPGLFLTSFLASTILPFASGLAVFAMPALGFNAGLIFVSAIAGAFLGKLTNYYIGLKGADFLLARYISIESPHWQRAEQIYKRWGIWALFFSWLPFVGDPLTAVAGAFKVRLGIFIFWILFGLSVHYGVMLVVAELLF